VPFVAGTTGTQILYNRASQRQQATYVSDGKTLQENHSHAVDGFKQGEHDDQHWGKRIVVLGRAARGDGAARPP
jgi:hypothetical protein